MKEAAKAAYEDVGNEATAKAEETGEKVGEAVGAKAQAAGEQVKQAANEAGEAIANTGETGQQAGDTIETNFEEVEQQFNDCTTAVGRFNKAAKTAAEGTSSPASTPINKDLKQTGTYAIQAAMGLVSMGTAVSALADNIKSGDINIKQLLTSTTSILMTANMAKSALTSLLPALGASAAAAWPIVIAVGALVAIYEG